MPIDRPSKPASDPSYPASSIWRITAPAPDRKKALFLARKIFSELIFDTAALEDSPYTFPEIQTLLEGITVGGHTLSDERLVLNQSESWKRLLRLVEQGQFTLSKETACHLHEKVAYEEALTWGRFRDIQVTIAGTEWMPPPADQLDQLFQAVLADVDQFPDPHEKGIRLFLHMARHQFFADGNKRTGRLMMNGVILASGHEVISVPAKRRLEFNQKMVRFYDSGDMEEMIAFMLSCGRNLEVERR